MLVNQISHEEKVILIRTEIKKVTIFIILILLLDKVFVSYF